MKIGVFTNLIGGGFCFSKFFRSFYVYTYHIDPIQMLSKLEEEEAKNLYPHEIAQNTYRKKERNGTTLKRATYVFSLYMCAFVLSYSFFFFLLLIVEHWCRRRSFAWSPSPPAQLFLSASVNIIYSTPATIHSYYLLNFSIRILHTYTIFFQCNTKLFHYNAYIFAIMSMVFGGIELSEWNDSDDTKVYGALKVIVVSECVCLRACPRIKRLLPWHAFWLSRMSSILLARSLTLFSLFKNLYIYFSTSFFSALIFCSFAIFDVTCFIALAFVFCIRATNV